MKLGVIGTGYWGSNHARVAVELEEDGLIEEVIFCDLDEDRVTELASNYGVEFVTDYRELISRVDAAVIATPSHTHRDIAITLLSNGVDCLVEKPLAIHSDTAWEIVETANQNNRTLAVGHIFRYHPALQAVKERIDRGELGHIKYLHTNRYSFRVPRESSGVLHQLAVHDVDIYRYLLGGHPDRIFCATNSWIRDDIEETATLTLNYENTIGTINESWQVPVFGKKRELIVIGTERSAYIDYLKDTEFEIFDSRIRREDGEYRAMEEGQTTHETRNAEPLREEVTDFLMAIENDRSPLASGQVGAEAISLLERAAESERTNSAVSVGADQFRMSE
ncbi:Gfo/Idh/MocA family protein [Haloplanus aerogenes]|uniref:Gfo/Idh/MocA family oxidoreductase n=1 Tax=Haloplanus aerogenes TaxID=660522 RepID=A0A3M0DS06_9EURY|nr:Gfo/Idh/MocA family oxidoreductase [Haloplanus aerogenes]AZH24766.1 gfo/Idh/MocA family oxidoreductase [Haloplanus aerogenes]RMB23570.1 UDP-N-acetylglucosamine 3-dehydrogenase [Haloplanus aerogenes]